MTAVREQFQKFGHKPSEAHYQGLERVAEVIQAMAEGNARLEKNFYLSFLPPGIGKTTTLTCAVKSLLEIDRYKGVGVIIFLSRVAEIGRLVTEMKLEEQDYSVFVSEEYEEEKLGNSHKTRARMMFTTQQMLVSRLRRSRNFAEVADFHWNGTPRQVRVWDESLSPAQPITIGYYQLLGLVKNASREGGPKAADTLAQLAETLRLKKDSDLIEMPDLRKLGLDSSEMRSWYESQTEKSDCELLFRLSGKSRRVRKDVANTALDYETLLSDDLGPLLVLDASGQFRKVYEFWAGTQGNLFALPSPQKNYQGLTIHHWDRGAGLQAREDNGGELVGGIIAAINTIPKDASVLVVYHKRKSKQEPDWEKAISERIHRKNVHFCNWGKHTATNDYQKCEHVILAGVLQYGASQYEAIARGAKRLRVEDDLSEDDLCSTRVSEIAHNIFQAACRGKVRQAVGDQCPPGCHLYVIGSSHTRAGVTDDLLLQIFPGADVQEWTPIISLIGRQQQQLFRVLASQAPGEIQKQALCEKLGIKHHQQVNALLDNPRLRAKLEAAGRKIELGRGMVTLTGAPVAPYELEESGWVDEYPL
jgi:hypothetical protein